MFIPESKQKLARVIMKAIFLIRMEWDKVKISRRKTT